MKKLSKHKAEATALKEAAKTKEGKIETVDVSEFALNPPVPFDLGSLQSEAYKLFRYTPMRTSTFSAPVH